MNRQMRKLRSPLYLFALVVIVAGLVSATNLGPDSIMYILAASVVIVIAVPIVFKLAVRQIKASIHGNPTFIDHAVAPSGYRRARRAESPEEAARYSAVQTTENRPLIVDADPDTKRALVRASSRAVVKTSTNAPPARQKKLLLADGLTPPLSEVLGRSITYFGMRGSGKSFAVSRFLEQLLRGRLIPALVLDYKGDYSGLPAFLGKRAAAAGSPEMTGPAGVEYWPIHPENARSAGWNLMDYGRQVVVNLGSYESLDQAAEIATKMLDGMKQWSRSKENPPPVIVCLDEAQQFLPQDRSISPINPEKTTDLLKRFEWMNSAGRSLGYSLIIATQRPQQIRKEVIGGTEVYFLMKQTQPRDLEIYTKLLGKDASVVATFKTNGGEALVLVDGESFRTTFYPRESESGGRTPQEEDARTHYSRKEASDISQIIRQARDLDDEAQRRERDEWTPEIKNGMPSLADMPNPYQDEAEIAPPPRSNDEIMLEKALRLYRERGIRTCNGLQAELASQSYPASRIKERVWPKFKTAVMELERPQCDDESEPAALAAEER